MLDTFTGMSSASILHVQAFFCFFFTLNVTEMVKKSGSIFNLRPPPPVCLCACAPVQGDDAVGQLYLIPAAVHHVSGGTEQAVRTQNESEADRADRAATGDRAPPAR